MAKRKRKHHFKPRRPGKNAGPFMIMSLSGFGSQGNGLEELFCGMEKNEYNLGREARESGLAPDALSQFSKAYEELNVPAEIKDNLIQTYYIAYLDGFNDKPFKRRVICEIE